MGEQEQGTAVVETSTDQGGALGGGGSTQEGVKPETSTDGGSTAVATTEGQSPAKTQDVDYKAELEREREARKKTEDAYRQIQAERDAKAAENKRLIDERKRRVADILANPDTLAQIEADPQLRKQFDDERIALQVEDEIARRSLTLEVSHRQREWGDAEQSLINWTCSDKDGPQLTVAEFQEWNRKFGGSFNGDVYKSAKDGLEAAKIHIKGMYFDKFASRVRTSEQEDAHKKAMNTIKDANPPGSSSASIGNKAKTPRDAELEFLGSGPKSTSARDFFKTGK